jgi:hypothetical protein
MDHKLSLGRQRIPSFIVIVWLVLWAILVITWAYDDSGYSVGMPMPVFFIQLLSPLLIAFVLGWRKLTLWDGTKVGMVAGAVFGLANMAAQMIWAGILLALDKAAPEAAMGWVDVLVEVLAFTVLFTLTGLVLGLVGGLAGVLVARLLHHRTGEQLPG